MQFYNKKNTGRVGNLMKILIRVAFFFITVVLLVVLVDKINFPYPNKIIQKIIPNENFKIVK